jgi:hypothetical protein
MVTDSLATSRGLKILMPGDRSVKYQLLFACFQRSPFHSFQILVTIGVGRAYALIRQQEARPQLGVRVEARGKSQTGKAAVQKFNVKDR